MQSKMLAPERQNSLILAVIFSLRMFGLFIILPIFAVYAADLKNANPSLVGMALGVYGLTQGLLQLPFGYLSDKIGRQKVIVFGMIVFALGSFLAGFSESIYSIIFARALQGAGAVGSTVLALAGDISRDEIRNKVMAIIGSSIGGTFAIALVTGPLIAGLIGVNGIFWLTAILAIFGILLLKLIKPVDFSNDNLDNDKPRLLEIAKNPKLLKLCLAIFIIHAILTAIFLQIPVKLHEVFLLAHSQQSLFYFLCLLLSFIFFVPIFIFAERKNKSVQVLTLVVCGMLLSLLALLKFNYNLIYLFFSLALFFVCFNFLEAYLPSMASKIYGKNARGTAMGLFSSSQFLGIFAGGGLGGVFMQINPESGVYYFCLALSFGLLVILRKNEFKS